MKCVLPGGNVAILGKAIHALAKIAEEVCFEGQEDRFILHAVSLSRSAYSRFYFMRDFFTSYELNEILRCKMAIRSCLLAFKSIHNLDKKVLHCSLEISENNIVLQLHCKFDVIKTYKLPAIEAEIRNPPFPPGNWKNVLTARTRLLADAVLTFHSSVEEVTLKLTEDKMNLSNYTEDEPDPSAVVHTELSIDLAEFDDKKIGELTEITFCLKELKAVLAFVEGMNIPITISFDGAGRPAVFSIAVNANVQTDFVLSTLAEVPGDTQESSIPEPSERMKMQTEKIDNGSSEVSGKRPFRELGGSLNDAGVHMEESAPSNKKYRSLFGGLLKGQTFSSFVHEPNEILASASEEEDDDDCFIMT